jgi:hypothetical protein
MPRRHPSRLSRSQSRGTELGFVNKSIVIREELF